MRNRIGTCSLAASVLLFCGGLPLCAQSGASQPVVKGVVTGHVYCADTEMPARFASVQLKPEKDTPPQDLLHNADKMDFTAVLGKLMQGGGLSTLTKIDGSFRLENVPPGVYYVIPQLDGYLSPLSGIPQEELLTQDEETRAKIHQSAQKITVTGGGANVDLRLERGASITGRISYDDGSPAPNVQAHLLLKAKDGKWLKLTAATAPGQGKYTTDDRGAFHFAGLPAGEYAVMAELPVTQISTGAGLGSFNMQIHPGDALQVYSGNVYRQSEAKGFSVTAAEDSTGVELVFPVNGLYSVNGTVASKLDHHLVNSAHVQLLDPADKSSLRAGTLTTDGTFQFEYVPAGEYLLRVSGAADIDMNSKPDKLGGFGELLAAVPGAGDALRKHLHEYGMVELPLSVHGEMSGIAVAVPDQKDAAEPQSTPKPKAQPIPDSLNTPLSE
ncbi:MAG: carboxypeptidase-like regulatory domain-containing protein [Acidobacteriota bacterium]|nr:carboxypeptidase-like regulatory domain-containing protein [Acidobacteriota bacterium]